MVRAITLNQAKKLSVGDTLYCRFYKNSDGTAQRWRVNGAVKTWKTRPNEVQVPLKHGLYDYGHLTQDNLDQFSLTEPKRQEKGGKNVNWECPDCGAVFKSPNYRFVPLTGSITRPRGPKCPFCGSRKQKETVRK